MTENNVTLDVLDLGYSDNEDVDEDKPQNEDKRQDEELGCQIIHDIVINDDVAIDTVDTVDTVNTVNNVVIDDETNQQNSPIDQTSERQATETRIDIPCTDDEASHEESPIVTSPTMTNVTDLVVTESPSLNLRHSFERSQWKSEIEVFNDPRTNRFRTAIEHLFHGVVENMLTIERHDLERDDLIKQNADRMRQFAEEDAARKRKFDEIESELSLAKDSLSANNMERTKLRMKFTSSMNELIQKETEAYNAKIAQLEKIKDLI